MKNTLLALLGFIVLPVPLAVIAQQSGDFTYTSDGSAITITYYSGPGGAVAIPDTIAGLPVTTIGGSAFQFNCCLASVTIPGSVTSIENQAFYSCASLTNVTIAASVASIGDNAFDSCTSLSSVTISNGATSIGNASFHYCYSLASVTIPGSVSKIGFEAFEYCTSLTSITIPGSVTNIGSRAFADCARLITISVDAANPAYSSLDGVLFDKSQTTLLQCPGGKVGSYLIPVSVTTIGYSAFDSCQSLTNVTIPANVMSIGDYAFEICTSLTSLAIPDSVTNLGVYAFDSCASLTSVRIPGSVTAIPNHAFGSCSGLTNVTISNGVTRIIGSAFDSCTSLTRITIPDSVTYIGPDVFDKCTRLMAITVDAANASYSSADGVLFNTDKTTLIAFPGGKAGSYSIPGSVINIRSAAFYYATNLISVSIPAGVASIEDGTFSYCTKLSSVSIPGSVTNIGFGAFSFCTSLTNITIPDSVTFIGDDAFDSCISLKGFFFKGNAPIFGGVPDSYVFYGDTNSTVYYLPGTTGWSTFGGRPTSLWNPLIQTSDSSFGVGPAGFGFNITGTTNIPIVVEAASNLFNARWVELQSLNLTNGAFYFNDPNWTKYPTRFYHIRSP